jgi:site-specific DNA-methyltransferase (adenine-specific)
MKRYEVVHGNCLEVLKEMPDNSVDSIVTDPPYGLGIIKNTRKLLKAWMRGEDGSEAVGSTGFLGKSWDASVPPPVVWKEVLRVLKPGGHLLVFSGTRTQDLMGMSLRLAGAKPRNCLAWMYGSGYPKSVNISKEIDKTLGCERDKVKINVKFCNNAKSIKSGHGVEGGDRPWMKAAKELGYHLADSDVPASDEAREWDGWGSDVKPAYEPILVMRKPLAEKTLAENVIKHGAGGINIDACRIETSEPIEAGRNGRKDQHIFTSGTKPRPDLESQYQSKGRFPANVLLSEEAAEELDKQSGECKSAGAYTKSKEKPIGDGGTIFKLGNNARDNAYAGEEGGASRFFYVAKASTEERSLGLEGYNDHPTLKPIELMRYLVRLVTPKDGVVLDPFCGSGSTGCACAVEGMRFIGVEQDQKFVELATKRIAYYDKNKDEFTKKKKVVDAAKVIKATPQFKCKLFVR